MPHIFRHFNNYREERFATALLASALEVSNNFRNNFIKKCLKIDNIIYAMNTVETEVCINLKNNDKRRIDILISDDCGSAIGIEVKIESGEIEYSEGVTQTQCYKYWLESNYYNNNSLIYITKYNKCSDGNGCIHILWREVINILSDVISMGGENNNILLFELRKYIEEEIMGFNGFSFQDKFRGGDYNLKLLNDEIYSFVTTLTKDYIKTLVDSRYSDGSYKEDGIEYDYYCYGDKKSDIYVGVFSYKDYGKYKQITPENLTGNRFQVWKNDKECYGEKFEDIVNRFKVGTNDLNGEFVMLAKKIKISIE